MQSSEGYCGVVYTEPTILIIWEVCDSVRLSTFKCWTAVTTMYSISIAPKGNVPSYQSIFLPTCPETLAPTKLFSVPKDLP